MFVDRELDWKHTQAVAEVEELKKAMGWRDGRMPRAFPWSEYLHLIGAEEAAEAAGRAVVERAMQVEVGRSRAAVTRLQEEHDQRYYTGS